MLGCEIDESTSPALVFSGDGAVGIRIVDGHPGQKAVPGHGSHRAATAGREGSGCARVARPLPREALRRAPRPATSTLPEVRSRRGWKKIAHGLANLGHGVRSFLRLGALDRRAADLLRVLRRKASRSDRDGGVPIGQTFACANCGRRGRREHMVPQQHGGATSWYCAHCARV